MKGFRAPTQEQAGVLIGMIAVLFGGWVRLLIPQMAGFPVNDGGLFYVMLRDLLANGLRLPAYVQYNGLNIPFAYPPLGFYAGALAAIIFRLDPIKVLQWLPAVVMIAALPAFYWLARVVLGTSFRAGVATLIFAFTPRAITWQIMGGGLTRSFGQLFLILALASIYQTFTSYSRKRLALAILFSSLVVLSHPEAALQTVGTAILFWLFKGRSKNSALHALCIGAGTLIISAVWWLPTIIQYGAGTLLSAAQTGLHSWVFLLVPFLFNFIDEPMMTLIAVLGLIGVAFELSRRRLLLPLWFVAPFVVEPRSAPTTAMIPLGMLAALALTEIILPAVAGLPLASSQGAGVNVLRFKPALVFLVFAGLYMFGDASYFGARLAQTTLRAGTREAFTWIRQSTAPGSRFLVLTGTSELFCDSTEEWFPALTGRISIATIQGAEWQRGAEFQAVREEAQPAQDCLKSEDPLSCVEGITRLSGHLASYDYVYVSHSRPILQGCAVAETSQDGGRLIDELKTARGYKLVYDGKEATVFSRR